MIELVLCVLEEVKYMLLNRIFGELEQITKVNNAPGAAVLPALCDRLYNCVASIWPSWED